MWNYAKHATRIHPHFTRTAIEISKWEYVFWCSLIYGLYKGLFDHFLKPTWDEGSFEKSLSNFLLDNGVFSVLLLLAYYVTPMLHVLMEQLKDLIGNAYYIVLIILGIVFLAFGGFACASYAAVQIVGTTFAFSIMGTWVAPYSLTHPVIGFLLFVGITALGLFLTELHAEVFYKYAVVTCISVLFWIPFSQDFLTSFYEKTLDEETTYEQIVEAIRDVLQI